MGPTTVGTMVLVAVTIRVSVEIPTMDQIVPAKDVSCVLKYYVLLYIYSIAIKFSGRNFVILQYYLHDLLVDISCLCFDTYLHL